MERRNSGLQGSMRTHPAGLDAGDPCRHDARGVISLVPSSLEQQKTPKRFGRQLPLVYLALAS